MMEAKTNKMDTKFGTVTCSDSNKQTSIQQGYWADLDGRAEQVEKKGGHRFSDSKSKDAATATSKIASNKGVGLTFVGRQQRMDTRCRGHALRTWLPQ